MVASRWEDTKVIAALARENHLLAREVARLRQNIEYAIERVDAGVGAEEVAVLLSQICTWKVGALGRVGYGDPS